MRIGFFVWEYPPRIVGGLGTYAENICPEMVKQGYDVSVFTFNDGTLSTRETLKGVDVNRPMIIDGTGILPVWMTDDLRRWGTGIKFFNDVLLHNIISATKFVNELIKKEGYRFDIICAHDWLSAMAGIMAKRETKLPYVQHFHSTERGRALNGGSETIFHIERTAGDVADKIVTVSYPMQAELIKQGFNPDKIHVCWNGINVNRYKPEKVSEKDILALRNKYEISSEEKMLLFVGRLTGVKGVIQLVQAIPAVINRHSKVKVVILGKGELEGSILDLIERLNIRNNVKTRFEFLSEEERILHYGACDLFVAPSIYEPFGIIALEAMAMEKPVVVGARDTSGFRDFVIPSGPDQTGIHVDGNNSADIAWGINSLLDNMEAAKEMGKKGRKTAEDLTWEKAVEFTIKSYEKIIEKAQPAQPQK